MSRAGGPLSEETPGGVSPPDNSLTPQEDGFAAELRGFGPVGLLAFLGVLGANLLPLLGPMLVLVWRALSDTPWREIGYVRPRSWARTALGGILFGIALKLLMKSVVMPFLGAPPTNFTYQFLVGNPAAMLGMLVVMIVVAGWGEETFYRGYLFERLGKLLGTSRWAKLAIVLSTSALFSLLHLHDQGWAGAEQAAMTGLIFGTIFASTGSLWFPIFTHAAFDVTAVLIIYAGLERPVAHWFFHTP
jgi:membrane protease YdiL (CAAX protease family)